MAERETIHLVEFSWGVEDLSVGRIFQRVAPHINLKVYRMPGMYSGVPADVFGSTEDVRILVAPPRAVATLLKSNAPLPSLQWVHALAAGVNMLADYYRETNTQPPFRITRSVSMAAMVSEHIIGQILAHQRQFYQFYDQQKEKSWNRRTGGTRLLRNFTVVLLGVGNIGTHTAQLCKAFGMTVHGVTNNPVPPERQSPHVDLYSPLSAGSSCGPCLQHGPQELLALKGLNVRPNRTVSELDLALSEGDYIVSALPSTPGTKGLLDNDKLQACKDKKPVFINVGRGDLLSEESIIKALRSGWISEAVLDVFPVEPLPQESPLWTEPGVIITPHRAANHNEEISSMFVDEILENYRRFKNGQPLVNEVDIQRGY